MDNNNKQTQKYSQLQCNLRQQKTLDISKAIISGTTSVSGIEIGLTIKNTFESPNMKSIFKGENGQIGFSVVNILVKRFLESFGFATKMNDTQIEVLTVDTLEKFSYESLEDIILFFKMARTGQFGSTMRGVDSNLIFGEWYPMYLELKSIEREKIYQKDKDSLNKDSLTIENVRSAYQKQKNTPQQLHDKAVKRINEITEGFTRQELEDLIKVWEKDESKNPYMRLLMQKRLDIGGDYKF